MEIDRGAWGRFVVRALVLGVVVFSAVRLAVARDGVAGGAARSYVTVAGTLTGVREPSVGLTFQFRRTEADGGVSPALCAPTVPTRVREGGAFAAEVPLASDAAPCPDDLFDGRDVVVEVAVGGVPIVGRFAVNPVPYAVHADVANAAGGQLEARIAALDQRVRALEGSAGMSARGSGRESVREIDRVIPLSALVGGSSTRRDRRALLLTVRADGVGLVHTGTWIVITGGQGGAVVSTLPLAHNRYVGVSAINVVATSDQGVFLTEDIQRGVTLRFANWPAGEWSWSYTAVPVDLPPM